MPHLHLSTPATLICLTNMLIPQTLTLHKKRDSELCCPPLCLQSPVLCLVIDSYVGLVVGGSLIKVNFKVMTKDMVIREKRTKREVIMKIFLGRQEKRHTEGGNNYIPAQKSGERRERGWEREMDINSLLTMLSSWAPAPLPTLSQLISHDSPSPPIFEITF